MRSTRRSVLRCLIGLGVCAAPVETYAQTSDLINCNGRLVRSLDFSDRIRISGTENAANSVYRYLNVGDGVNAEVTILGFVDGGSLATIDRDTGLTDNFQPEFRTTGISQARFRFDFFDATTNTPIEIDFAASAIDVDGNRNAPTQVGLRELTEFQNDFVESLLSTPTELVRNNNGNFTPGFTRFESNTDQFAPGIDETATANIVTVFYTDVSSFEYNIGTVGTGTQTRLNSLGFNCPNLQQPISSPEKEEDFGDAPLLNFGNPIHTLSDNIRLGATNTADLAPQDNPTAIGDTGDDGVTFGEFIQTRITEITVNVLGVNGYLQGWVDWNADNDFNDTNEQISIDVQDTDEDGVITLNVEVPEDAATSTVFARFRWSTVEGLESNTAAGDGEVEDYQIGPIVEAIVNLNAIKSVEVYDPDNLGLYMTPGNEVLYKITVTNAETSNASANNVDIVDTLPENLKFISAETIGFTGGNFGNPDLPSLNQDCAITPCIVSFENGSVAKDSVAEVQVRALIK